MFSVRGFINKILRDPDRKRERKAAYKLTKPRSHSDVTFVQRRLARL